MGPQPESQDEERKISSRMPREKRYVHTNFRVLHWYNLLVGHVGIHGQRRVMEALVNGSLFWKKEYPTESSPQAKNGLSYRARVYAHAAR
ncbi:hypothetical protein Taro_025945 [Colocasia esculenta]|uniref:Uncharacterized protein n=1 Tax=Colocasia esculenta TaxID=4460 RepID=A0A843VBK6_COLES|nr:hypothetical protein [Colocasia esculenta]